MKSASPRQWDRSQPAPRSRQGRLRESFSSELNRLHGAEQAPGVVDHPATDDGGDEGQVVVEHDHVRISTR